MNYLSPSRPAALLARPSATPSLLPSPASTPNRSMSVQWVISLKLPTIPPSISLENTFTVAAWIKRSTLNVSATIYDFGTQTNHWYVGLLSNNKMAFTTNGAQDFASATHTINDTNWHHVAYVANNSNLTMYLDGCPRHPASRRRSPPHPLASNRSATSRPRPQVCGACWTSCACIAAP